ncbi:CHAT domain-containing protein [Nocardioides sp. YR527]|uniref:CHAT domain-containing protein n=1 Tax=Nocardioides sp. YR527 TaxID=1881028 RepID=UPI00159FB0D1|nr:CHAT domain-containing protein [Nocardioides sp. YR527]
MQESEPASSSHAGRINQPRPLYVVLCPVSSDPTAPYEPLAFSPDIDAATTSFDPELMPVLPAIWYALHLPKTRFDVVDMPPRWIRESLSESRRHNILLVQREAHEDPLFPAWLGFGEPTLVLCADDDLRDAEAMSAAGGFALPPASVSSLSQETLEAHWKAMSDRWESSWPSGIDLAPTSPRDWTPDISLEGSVLSLRRLARILGSDSLPAVDDSEPSMSALQALRLRARIEALTTLAELDEDPEDPQKQFDSVMETVVRRIRAPLALTLPGVAPRYRRLVREHGNGGSSGVPGTANNGSSEKSTTGSTPPTARPSGDPPEVLGLMVAHQAAGDDSMGVVIVDPVPDTAFVALADLERYWLDGVRSARGVQPAKEEKLRGRLDDAMASFWTDSMVTTIQRASRIDAYTNFPIGLLRMPGSTAPLAAMVPIAYRPINPLTRALQLEFDPDRVTDLSAGMRVLVVECIPTDDVVGRISRSIWSEAASNLNDETRSVSVDLVSVNNKAEFIEAVAKHRPDVLVISAHGIYQADSNLAGLMIGTERSIGTDLGPMPPMVILSACHTGPRGGGPVAVADLLLRQGARAVLSTLVPVGVFHNSVFMRRLLLYMSESIAGTERHVSMLDLWHRVQTNTVIMDILYGNPRLMDWGHSSEGGVPPIFEFMSRRAAGRISPEHLYDDAEAVLLEIAAERHEEEKVQGWLRSPGYLPESMMYTFIGDPSAIRLQAPRLITRIDSGQGPVGL